MMKSELPMSPVTLDPACQNTTRHYISRGRPCISATLISISRLAGSCSNCRYIYSCKSDEKKYVKLIHGGARAMKSAEVSNKNAHRCPVCDDTSPTCYQRQKHQNTENHKLNKSNQQH
ncbi:hypothetical protein ATANTOWER_008571 [Ataeniobius toweri]|uniref:Uncharacterized protein n=1 Tax=Ataeniobius toweri TaxID=208326 RepID=A0ABU7CHS5_9TELE|nr:hypothetical protein [Ataeniobius toweri]